MKPFRVIHFKEPTKVYSDHWVIVKGGPFKNSTPYIKKEAYDKAIKALKFFAEETVPPYSTSAILTLKELGEL